MYHKWVWAESKNILPETKKGSSAWATYCGAWVLQINGQCQSYGPEHLYVQDHRIGDGDAFGFIVVVVTNKEF